MIKKLLSVLACILLALIVFSPLCSIICTILGYKFTLVNPGIFAIAIFALTALTVLVSILYKDTVESKVMGVVMSLLTPCALVNTGFYIRACGTLWIVASLLICAGCAYLTIRHGNPTNMRIGAMVLTAGLILPMALFCFLLSVAGKTQNYVVLDTVESPSGGYYAQIVDNEQGEKGGSKMVRIYPDKDITTPIFKIQKKPIIIYDELYEAEDADKVTIDIQWKNETDLVINGKDYSFR